MPKSVHYCKDLLTSPIGYLVNGVVSDSEQLIVRFRTPSPIAAGCISFISYFSRFGQMHAKRFEKHVPLCTFYTKGL